MEKETSTQTEVKTDLSLQPRDMRESLIQITEPLIIIQWEGGTIDSRIVSDKFYNSFNYSKFPAEYQRERLTIGVTSSRTGEGKTLVASNLATSFALGYKKRTVIIDLNMRKPRLHKVFGVKTKPGLSDIITSGKIELFQTEIPELFVLPAGERTAKDNIISLKDLITIREIINILEQQFDFVVLDMGPVFPVKEFPVQITNEVSGLIVVIDSKRTNHEDLEKVFQQLDEKQMMGFVLNKVGWKG